MFHPRLRQISITLFTSLIVVLAACAPANNANFYKTVSEATLKAGDAIPEPSGEVILTVTGNIGTTNADDSILMDQAMIEAAGQIEYTVTDPFENKDTLYRGPLVSDLLKLWQVPEDATILEVSALDDYTADVPIEDLKKYPVIFALQQDGLYMPVSTRGPAMLVYPYNNFDFKQEIYNDYWVWQINSINVK
jgi:hypothetical protein